MQLNLPFFSANNILTFTYRRMPRKIRDLFPDKIAVEADYRNTFGTDLRLDNPVTFNEKINWIKLYDRNPLMTRCSDKFAVREYVKSKGCEHILNELHGVYNSVDEIDFSALPMSCVLKVTHGSGWNVFIKNGNVIINKRVRDMKTAIRRLKIWMGKSQYIRYREWAYKDIIPRILCEKFMENTDGSLDDYKIHCFHGVPLVIQNIVDRATNPSEAFFDPDWRKLELISRTYPPAQRTLMRPQCLEKMLHIASALSNGFNYARVDLYNFDGCPIFGELTFYPHGGGARFNPVDWDIKFGSYLKLPLNK